MSPEQILALGGIVLSILFGAREVAKYIWSKFRDNYDRMERQLEELLGSPARADKPAVEGKVPQLERLVTKLERQIEDAAEEKQREQQEHRKEIEQLNATHQTTVKRLVDQHQLDIRKAVADAIEPIKRQHVQELRAANENAENWKRTAEQRDQEVVELKHTVTQRDQELTRLTQTVERMQGEIDDLKKRDTGKLNPAVVPETPPDSGSMPAPKP